MSFSALEHMNVLKDLIAEYFYKYVSSILFTCDQILISLDKGYNNGHLCWH